MPTWKTTLPDKSHDSGYRLRRTPASGPLRGIVTADRLLVVDTHYWHARTTSCERITNAEGRTTDDSLCPACIAKQPWRTHCYVPAFDPKTREHFIFECTDAAALPFEEYFAANGTLRGCLFLATRTTSKTNGKVSITTTAADLQKYHIPPAPDLPRALCVIWRVPQPSIAPELAARGRNRLESDPKALLDMLKPADNDGALEQFEDRRSAVIDELRTTANGNGKPKKQKAPA